jgi:short-subunit dehydrogenase
MREAARRTALVTGASAGIGLAFAHVFAERGFDLVVTARRGDRLEALARELAERHGTRTTAIVADLSDPATPARIVSQITAAGITVDALVNNAGYGVPGSYRSTRWEQQRDLVQVLITAVAELTHRLLPGMIARGYGRIVNVASLAGLVPSTAGHTLYGASKAFVIRFSQALAQEVSAHGVHVTAVCPGFTYSEFHDVTGTRDRVSRLPSFMWMDARAVALRGYEAVETGRPIIVTGGVNRIIAALAKYVPEPLVMLAVRSNSGRFRASD